MKKIYLLSVLLLSAILSYGQADCANALTPVDGTNTIPATSDSFYWYTFTTGANPGKVIIEGPTSNFLRLSDGECNALTLVESSSSTPGNITVVDLAPNDQYFLRITVNGGDFDWTFSEEALEAGDACSIPATAVEGTNSLPDVPNEYYYYSYTVAEANKKLNITSNTTKQITAYKGDCTAPNFIESANSNLLITDVEIGDEIFIRWRIQGDGAFDWNLAIEDVIPGESCSNAIVAKEIEEGSNTVPVTTASEYWYIFTVPDINDARIFFDGWPSGVNATIFSGTCESPTFEETVSNTSGVFVDGYAANEQLFIRLNLDGNNDFQWTIEVPVSGDDCRVPANATLGENTLPVTDNFNYWYLYTIPANSEGKVLTVSTTSNATMGLYHPDCFSSSEIVDGDESISTTQFSSGDDIYIRFGNLGGGDFTWNLTLADILPGEQCTDPQTAQEGLNSVTGNQRFFEFTATETDEYTISSVDLTTEDTYLRIYDVCNGTELFSNDDFGGSTQSEVSVDLTVDESILIYWSGENNSADFEWSIYIASNQQINFPAIEEKTFGDAPFELNATASSGLDVSYTSSDETVATIADNVVTIVGAGTSVITATQAGDESIEAAIPVERELIVNKAEQTITFEAIADKTFSDAPFQLTATSSADLTITYSSSDEAVATITGDVVTIVGTGTTTITATQEGNDNIAAATPVEQGLIVEKANQTIIITSIPDKFIFDDPFEVEVSTSSELSLNLSVDGPATISGNLITLDGTEGTVILTASQAGNENYNAAEEQVSFQVTDPCSNYAVSIASINNVSCFEGNDGQINLTIQGGTTPFQYFLNGDEVAEEDLSALAAGNYELTVTDVNGCEATVTGSISQPESALSLTATVNESTEISGNGSISVQVAGGTAPYEYEWNTGDTESSLENLSVGEYEVTVTDANGCTINDSFTVGGVTSNVNELKTEITLYPNPVKNSVFLNHANLEAGLKGSIVNASGKIVKDFKLGEGNTTVDISTLQRGIYFIILENRQGFVKMIK